jgi:hypothetical protein
MRRLQGLTWRYLGRGLLAAACVLLAGATWAQQLVVTTGTAVGGTRQLAPVPVFPDMAGAPADPPRNYLTAIDDPFLSTHGLALVAANRALATEITSNRIILIDTSTATSVESFTLPDSALNVHYDGFGTLAANPARTHVLALTDLNTLWVIPAPFDHTAVVTMVALPSAVGAAQTRAIAFDAATGRAYLALQSGIVALDPPYTSIAFTIPSSNGVVPILGPVTGAIALSPDGATLVATRGLDSSGYATDLRIFHGPFSAASVPAVLNVPGASLDGMTFTPDSNKILIVESKPAVAPALPRVYAVSAPYSSASTVETLSFDPGGIEDGFEDVDISADGQLAALSGGSGGNNVPLVLLKAPFTAAGFTFVKYDIPAFAFPFDQAGRGDGTARFWATAVPVPNPQVFVDPSVALSPLSTSGLHVTEGNSGTTDAVIPVDLSGPSTQTVTVDYTTVDGTAKAADNDYIPASGTLTFAPGKTQKNIVVKVVGDTTYELDESFTVVISNPVNATILGNSPGFADTATVIIVNDDAVIPFAILTTALPDGATGVPYSFQLTGQGLAPLTWSAGDLPFGLSVDPVSGIISGTPVFPGTTSVQILLTEGANFFTGHKFLDLTITGTAIPFLTLSPNPVSFGSHAIGSTSAAVQTTIGNQGGADLVLGNPIVAIPPGSEFSLATGFGACTAGQTIVSTFHCNLYFTFTPQAVGTRTLDLPLSSNVPAITLTLTGVGTGTSLPLVSIANAASVTEGNSGTTPMTFPVTLSAASASTVTVAYAATGGTATSGVDYTVAGAGTLTFAPGVTTQNIIINVIGDTDFEPDETVVMTLSGPVGATLGSASATGIILNDDAAPAPLLSILSGTPVFGDQPLATTSAPVSVTIGNTGGGTLTLGTPFPDIPGGDFAIASGTNACSAGESLAPSAMCNLYFTFTPSALGLRTANVALTSNAPTVMLVLSAIGVSAAASAIEPIPTLSPAMLIVLMCLIVVAGVCARSLNRLH